MKPGDARCQMLSDERLYYSMEEIIAFTIAAQR